MLWSIIVIVFKLLGALGLFMFGMELSSTGIQRAAGDRLQGTVNFMTRNRFVAVFTGVLVTVVIQSSSATTVMVVSFVNAGLLNLVQAIGVIMGANIGTTLTGWIIAAVGVQKFSIAAIAVPLFGVGFFMSLMKQKGDTVVSYGEGLMGFAMIFLGLEYLAKAIPDPSPDALLFLKNFADKGWFAILVCVLVGTVFTMLINASSATIAIVIGLSAKGILSFEMAAAITLGANIGTTFDSFLVSLGTNTNAKRAAWAHILFNVIGTVWVVVVLRPFITLVDWITPGPITAQSAGAHIAMMHTLFNAANTLVLLPFVRQYAGLLERFIKPKAEAEEAVRLQYKPSVLLSSPELNIAQARSDIVGLAKVAEDMFVRFREELTGKAEWGEETLEWFSRYGVYSGSLKTGITKFLFEIACQDIGERTRDSLMSWIRVVDDLENACHASRSMAESLGKAARKGDSFGAEAVAELAPYTLLVQEFISFVRPKLGAPLTGEDFSVAVEFENRIDACRGDLKKIARKRIKSGAPVKTELNYIDVIRHIERIGDCFYSISGSLRAEKAE
ncbi:MAG TPA: Na/Pi cotransporter family protein [Treponemataceae bacterium]|mgnify:CR=1 FL=1|nr:Na/Pi cotransporter family protein [Treponemataceae bacterium]